MLQSVMYLVHVLVVLLHARFSVVGPIPFLLAAIVFSGHPYVGSTTILLNNIHDIYVYNAFCMYYVHICTYTDVCTCG